MAGTPQKRGARHKLNTVNTHDEIVQASPVMLQCMSLQLMWWTAPALGIEVP